MDNVLIYSPQHKLNQDQIENLQRFKTSSEIKTFIKNLLTRKKGKVKERKKERKFPEQDGFSAESYHTFKQKLLQDSSNYTTKQKCKEHYQIHFPKQQLL